MPGRFGVKTTHNPPSTLSSKEREYRRLKRKWTQEVDYLEGRIRKAREYLERSDDPVETATLTARIQVFERELATAREKLSDNERLQVN